MLEIMSPLKLTTWDECRQRAHINLSVPPKCKGSQRLAVLQLDAFLTATHSASLNNPLWIFGLVSGSVNLLMKINRKYFRMIELKGIDSKYFKMVGHAISVSIEQFGPVSIIIVT